MKPIVTRSAIVFFFFLIGFSIILKTSPQYEMSRGPAAIRQNYDFSHLRGVALDQAVKDRIVAGMEIKKDAEHIGFSFGHFAFVNASGERTLGCHEYGKVRMTFAAEGTVVNGERPTMEVEGPCEFSEDLAKVNPLFLPMQKILAEKPADGEFQFRDGQEITVRFSNLSDEWPRQWDLTSITFHGQKSDVNIDKGEIMKAFGQPVLVSFTE